MPAGRRSGAGGGLNLAEMDVPAPGQTGAGAVVERADPPRDYQHQQPAASFAPTRIVIYRRPGHEIELRVEADARGVVLTRRELRRDDPLDLPRVVQLEVPAASVGALSRALQAAARAAGRAG